MLLKLVDNQLAWYAQGVSKNVVLVYQEYPSSIYPSSAQGVSKNVVLVYQECTGLYTGQGANWAQASARMFISKQFPSWVLEVSQLQHSLFTGTPTFTAVHIFIPVQAVNPTTNTLVTLTMPSHQQILQ